MRVEELDDSFLALHHHVVEHVDDIVLILDAVLGDLLDGVVELLVVLDNLRDVIVDVVRVLFDLLLLHGVDMPLSSLSSPLSFLVLSIIVPLSDVFGRGGDDE